jgi:hypothetical protein
MEDWISKNGIALISMTLSIFIFIKVYVWPFTFRMASGGRIVLTKDHTSTGFKHIFVFMDLIFTNTSAKRGFIRDVGLVIHDNGKKVHMFAKYVNTERRINFDPSQNLLKVESFIGFELKKEDSVVKQIGFSQNHMFEPFSMVPGRYLAELFVHTSRRKKWKKVEKFEFDLVDEDVRELNTMSSTPKENGLQSINIVFRDKRTVGSIDLLNRFRAEA